MSTDRDARKRKLLRNVDLSDYIPAPEPEQKPESDDSTKEVVQMIPISEIEDMPKNDYFYPYDDAVIDQIVEEIKTNGFQVPIHVVKLENGKYQCISGHQRKRAMAKMGEKEIPCLVKEGLTELQIHNLWHAENTLHRDPPAPLYKARILQSFADDFVKYGLKGSKREYVAKHGMVSPTQSDNLLLILRFPEDIQERCADSAFPYSALVNARKFNDEQMSLLSTSLKRFEAKHPHRIITNAELRKMIDQIISDTSESAYDDDSNLDKYDPVQNNELTELEKKRKQSYESYYHDNFLRSSSDVVLNDTELQSATDSVYRLLNQGYFVAQNRMSIEKSLYGLEEAVSMLKKYLKQ